MREWRGLWLPLGIWGVATIFTVIAGPFDTLTALPGFWQRLAYWGSIAGLSVALGVGAGHLAARLAHPAARIGLWTGLTLVLAGLVHGVNSALFAVWGGLGDFLYLLGTVGFVVLAVNWLLFAISARSRQPSQETTDPEDAILRRLPFNLRGPLVRLEAQDHYTKIVTTKGHSLILMRLSDAITDLKEAKGLQTHRSHWIALGQVVGSEEGRLLKMSDGELVPVSRKYRESVKAQGLL